LKILAVTIIALLSGSLAYADGDVIACLAGGQKPDGSLGSMSQNPAQVIVFKDGKVSVYSLKDAFSLLNSKYNFSKAIDLKFAKAYGKVGDYASSPTGDTAKFDVISDAKGKSTADISVDTAKLVGKIAVDSQDASGKWTGSTSDTLHCTKAGTIGSI
jgi:hypothetical protein